MNKDTLKVFETAEGNLSMTIMNPITIEHFDKLMKANGCISHQSSPFLIASFIPALIGYRRIRYPASL